MGKKKKQTVGYKYHLGLVLVLAEKLESIFEIKHGKKTAWNGDVHGGGRISIKRPQLFGKEAGGIAAEVDFLDGNPAQPQNDYYAGWRGPTISALRGVASLIYRQGYLGNKPYIDPIEIKCGNIHNHFDDWYPEKAEIAASWKSEGAAIYLALNASASMLSAGRFDAQKQATINLLNEIRHWTNTVKIVMYAWDVVDSIEKIDASGSDYDELISFVQNIPDISGNFGDRMAEGLSLAKDFFDPPPPVPPLGGNLGGYDPITGLVGTVGSAGNWPKPRGRRRIIMLTIDGGTGGGDDAASGAIVDSIDGVEAYKFTVDFAVPDPTIDSIDNTPGDGVPTVTGGDVEGWNLAFLYPFRTWVDMNPAHMLRQWIVDPARRGNGDPASIGASFTAAADTLYSERFGMSLRWDGSESRKKAITDIERHIDAYTYKDRVTGLWEVKLVRDDYDPATLPVFDNSNIVGWEEMPSRPRQTELPNSLTITYSNRDNSEPAAMTVTNSVSLSATGVLYPAKDDFLGVSTPEIASKILSREMTSTGTPLWSGSFYAAYADPEINRGSPIVINAPELGLHNVIGRVTTIAEMDVSTNKTLISFIEDKFTLGQQLVGDPDIPPADRSVKKSEYRFVQEAPYYMLVYNGGQAQIDSDLSSYPDIGYLVATGNQPDGGHINSEIATDAGSGYGETGSTDFSPHGLLVADVDRLADTTTFQITNALGLDQVAAGSVMAVGDELMRIDSIAQNGTNYDMTVGRGVLDTVPQKHAAGDAVLFFQNFADSNEVEYLAGQAIDVKLLNRTSTGYLHQSKADADHVLFSSRAIRPYPVGNFKVNGSYADFELSASDAVLTWAHRDRITQTTSIVEDHTHGDMGPEAGVSYLVEITAFDGSGASLGSVVSANVGTATTYTLAGSTTLPAGTTKLKFSVTTQRGVYDSWQSPAIYGNTLAAPSNLTGATVLAAPTNLTGATV